MNRIRSVIALALVAGLLASGAALAQGRRAGGPGDPGRAGGRGGRGVFGGLPLASLNLTQAQQDLIRDIRERNRQQAQQIEARVREAQLAQAKAVDAIPVNEALIRSTTQALADVQTEVAINRARVQSEIFAALTPEQQDQVKKLRAEREQRQGAQGRDERQQLRERRQQLRQQLR